jgi:hypothetical protein
MRFECKQMGISSVSQLLALVIVSTHVPFQQDTERLPRSVVQSVRSRQYRGRYEPQFILTKLISTPALTRAFQTVRSNPFFSSALTSLASVFKIHANSLP